MENVLNNAYNARCSIYPGEVVQRKKSTRVLKFTSNNSDT